MSSFTGVNTALRGLVAQRFGLDLTSQNIANALTEGYTRQRAELSPANPAARPALYSRWNGPGSGVEVSDVARLNDVLVDARVVAEREGSARLEVGNEVWSRIDSLLSEPQDQGLTEQMATFFNSWGDLANRPDSMAARVAVVQNGATVADVLGRLRQDLDVQWTQRRSDLDGLVSDLNVTAAGIADYNKTIQQSVAAGVNVNELMDRRDALVSSYVSATGAMVRSNDDGTVDLFVSGISAVRGVSHTDLSVVAGGPVDIDDVRAGNPVTLTWPGGLQATLPGGSIGATVEALNTTLPGVADSFDAVALDVSTQVNAIHTAGQDLNGVAGVAFFTGTTSSNLAVNAAVFADPTLVAAATAGAGALDGANADALAQLGSARTGPPATWRSTITDLGSEAAAAARRFDLQSVALTEAETARQSTSGVDTDEELTRMIMFQRAYEASSRMLTSIDEALDVLINRTGIVGR